MATKNQPLDITWRTFNTDTQKFVSGDEANQIVNIVQDGVESVLSNTKNPLSNGMTHVLLTATQMNKNAISFNGISLIDNIILILPSNIITEQGALKVIDDEIEFINTVTSNTNSDCAKSIALSAVDTVVNNIDSTGAKEATLDTKLEKDDYIDYFNKKVTDRTSVGNPKQYEVGTSTNKKVVNVAHTIFSAPSGNIEKADDEVVV